jgi:hypothetical protein
MPLKKNRLDPSRHKAQNLPHIPEMCPELPQFGELHIEEFFIEITRDCLAITR